MKKGRSQNSKAKKEASASAASGLSVDVRSSLPEEAAAPFGIIVAAEKERRGDLRVLHFSPLALLSSDSEARDAAASSSEGVETFLAKLPASPSLTDRVVRQASLMRQSFIGGCFIAGLWAKIRKVDSRREDGCGEDAEKQREAALSSLLRALESRLDFGEIANAFRESRPGGEGISEGFPINKSWETSESSNEHKAEDAFFRRALTTPFLVAALLPKQKDETERGGRDSAFEVWTAQGKRDNRAGADFGFDSWRRCSSESGDPESPSLVVCGCAFSLGCLLRIETSLLRNALGEAGSARLKRRFQTCLLRSLRRFFCARGSLLNEASFSESPVYCSPLFATEVSTTPCSSAGGLKGVLCSRDQSVADAMQCLSERSGGGPARGALRLEFLEPCLSSVSWILTEETVLASEAAASTGAAEVAATAGCVEESHVLGAASLLRGEQSASLALGVLNLRADALAYAAPDASLGEALRLLAADAASVASAQILLRLSREATLLEERHKAQPRAPAKSASLAEEFENKAFLEWLPAVRRPSSKASPLSNQGPLAESLLLRRGVPAGSESGEEEETLETEAEVFLFGEGAARVLKPAEPSLSILQRRLSLESHSEEATSLFWKTLALSTRGGKRQKALSFRMALVLLPLIAILFRVFSDHFY